jgi:hypothetical protein
MKNPVFYRPAALFLFVLFLLSWSPGPHVFNRSIGNIEMHSTENASASEKVLLNAKYHEEQVALQVYRSMKLQQKGLKSGAFIAAWMGHKQLLEEGMLTKKDILTICDYSQSSRRKRFYVIDIKSQKLLVQTYVAHGRNSGGEFATDFSNKPSSYKSSLGFYVTGNVYKGEHGIALNIDGKEKGFNDLASDRNIVVHGADYVGPASIRNKAMIGRSLGCPALPRRETVRVIQMIKDGSCFFIYHPSRNYLMRSTLLNG